MTIKDNWTSDDIEFSNDMQVDLYCVAPHWKEHAIEDFMTASTLAEKYDGTSQEQQSRLQGRLRRMIRDGHGTPFEAVEFWFQVNVPVFIAREWFRHRKGSFNELSQRYVRVPPKFFLPETKRVQTDTKRMNYQYEEKPLTKADLTLMRNSYFTSYVEYLSLLEEGMAREEARALLPIGIYTQFFWKTDLRNLTNFLILRNAPQAQEEMRIAATKVENIVKEEVPTFYAIWTELGRPRLASEDF